MVDAAGTVLRKVAANRAIIECQRPVVTVDPAAVPTRCVGTIAPFVTALLGAEQSRVIPERAIAKRQSGIAGKPTILDAAAVPSRIAADCAVAERHRRIAWVRTIEDGTTAAS